jgi:hypothetical protein
VFRAPGSALVLAFAVACSTAVEEGAASGNGEAGSQNAGSPAVAGESGGGAPGGGGSADNGGAPDSGGAPSSDGAYAHVTAVSTSGSDGAYTFSVSVESADIDCTQFADFWEVLDEDGSLLYRRILEHSHTDENGTTDSGAPGNTFTRDGGPVAIDAARVVIVRAHMNTSGYNGRALRGSVESGFADAPDIDASFAAGVEDEMPLPTGCLF